ncbi:ferredoxin [Streptosporangium soli]|nr:ferredoxin [Streptosporangium sp. KLBMP 9127]
MRVIVDEDRCVASGQCVMTAADVFDQREEDGIVVLLDPKPHRGLHDEVHNAVMLCPAGAIRVQEES